MFCNQIHYFKAPDKFPLDKYLSTTKATIISGATDIKADADKLHQGVIEEFRATTLTGNNCTSVKVKIKAIEKLIEKGITEIRTDNEENNPMYKINVSLGFEPVPFSLEYMKQI